MGNVTKLRFCFDPVFLLRHCTPALNGMPNDGMAVFYLVVPSGHS